MVLYSGYIVLAINDFEAESVEDAISKIDKSVDAISRANILPWDDADWKIYESESGNVVVPFYKEVYN